MLKFEHLSISVFCIVQKVIPKASQKGQLINQSIKIQFLKWPKQLQPSQGPLCKGEKIAKSVGV